MKRKMLWTIILCLSLVVSSIPIYAFSEAEIVKIELNDEEGLYKLELLETDNIRMTRLMSDEGECLMKLVLYKEQHLLYNPDNGVEMDISPFIWEVLKPCKVSCEPIKHDLEKTGSAHDYAYTFCQLGQYQYSSRSTSVGAIINMISTAVTIASVFAVIISIVGYGLTSIAFSTAQAMSQGIKTLFETLTVAALNLIPVYMQWRSKCQEMVEEEGSPFGPIYYLGYYPDSTYFFYNIGSGE